MRKVNRIAAGVGAALLMSYGMTAQADITAFTPSAYAESRLEVSNFRFFFDGQQADGPGSAGDRITVNTASVGSTLDASITGSTPDSDAGNLNPLSTDPADPTSFDLNVRSGPGQASYTPYTSFGTGTVDDGTYAGAASFHSGSGLNPANTTVAKTQAVVNLRDLAAGNASSRQTLGSRFTITVAAGANPVKIEVFFDAEYWVRVALGQGLEKAAFTQQWVLTVTPVGSLDPILTWTPDGAIGSGLAGACVVALSCTELADSFNLNRNSVTLSDTGDLSSDSTLALNKNFGLEAFLLSGQYVVNVSHVTSADAIVVSEPSTLALIGLSLCAIGIGRRVRRRS